MRPVGEQLGWGRWAGGMAAALCTVGFGLFAASGPSTSPREATALLEHFAAKLARARTIHPATADDLEQLLRRPSYDCAQVRCTADLEARNLAVRARLRGLLAQSEDLVRTAGAR